MIVNPDQEYRIQYKEGWSCPSGSASFGAIFEWSGSEFYELSCWILLVKPSGSNILHDITKQRVYFFSIEERMLRIQDKKRDLISGAFRQTEFERRQQRIQDIRDIFDL